MTDDTDAYQSLRKAYCPPLDEALFLALVSDYDITDESSLNELTALLDGLREQAIVEQELELAVAPEQDLTPHGHAKQRNHTSSSSNVKTDNSTFDESLASVNTGFSGLQTSDRGSSSGDFHDTGRQGTDFEKSSRDEQVVFLHDMFPTATSEQINESLDRHCDKPNRCFDELLNLTFLNDDESTQGTPAPVAKGIDGFLIDENNSSRGKGKSRGKKSRKRRDVDELHYSDQLSSGQATPNSNVWASASEDVEFLASRTQLPVAAARSMYHENSANLARTIRVLIDKEIRESLQEVKRDEILHLQAQELKFELDDVPDTQIYGALLIAKRLPSAAKDLLEAMHENRQEALPATRIVAQYAPIDLSDNDTEKSRKPPRTPSAAFPPGDPAILLGRASIHGNAAGQAFDQASAAYRRGKSNHLYGAAASYYAQVGHERRRREKELMSSAADSFVYQQSSTNSLDLHGVTVEQAVRIAKTSVEDWWEGLGDRKYVVGGIGSGYKIIVGVGTHSAQGIGRIGPAVTRMLMREGWKVNVQRGEVIVEGKARR